MRRGDGCVIIVDWKRSKAIAMDNERANMKYPLEHMSAANYWAYALQVNQQPLRLYARATSRANGPSTNDPR